MRRRTTTTEARLLAHAAQIWQAEQRWNDPKAVKQRQRQRAELRKQLDDLKRGSE